MVPTARKGTSYKRGQHIQLGFFDIFCIQLGGLLRVLISTYLSSIGGIFSHSYYATTCIPDLIYICMEVSYYCY
jgi:hypothetical protein